VEKCNSVHVNSIFSNTGYFNASCIDGIDLLRYREELQRFGSELARLHVGEMARLIAKSVETVTNDTCRIVVVGPPRSGKTSLVNNLIQVPGLLPCADWASTSALTRVHLGEKNHAGGSAVFNFLTEEEWAAIARGDIAKATGRTSAGSPVARELAQLRFEQVRSTVSKRLGADFQSLLNKQHKFESVTPELLSSYLCTDDGHPNGSVGQYGAIMAVADLYYDHNPFEYPALVTDTPGLFSTSAHQNRGVALEASAADAIVFVVGSHQLATVCTVEYVDFLRQLPIDRLVVYVNQRKRAAADEEVKISQAIAYLRREVSEVFSIIVGTLSHDEARAAVPRPPFPHVPNVSAGDVPVGPVFKLMPVLWRNISNGPHARALSEAAKTLHDVAHTFECWVKDQVEDTNAILVAKDRGRKACDTQLHEVQTYIDKISRLCDGIEKSCITLTDNIASVRSSSLSTLQVDLRKHAEKFVDAQCDSLSRALAEKADASWTCDTGDVVASVEREIATSYRAWQLALRKHVSSSVESIKDALTSGIPELAGTLPKVSRGGDFALPTFEIPCGEIAFRLDQGWFRRLFHRRGSPTELTSELRTLLVTEFELAIDATMRVIGAAVADDGTAVVRGISAKGIEVLNALMLRRAQLTATEQKLLSMREQEYADAGIASVMAERQNLETSLLHAARINQSFGELILRGAMMFGATPLAREYAGT
jgi:hypothetical protein